MASNVANFCEKPSLTLLEKCQKDELLTIAEHFDISVNRTSLVGEIKQVILIRLIEQNVIILPTDTEAAGQSVVVTETVGQLYNLTRGEAEAEASGGFSLTESLSPESPVLKEDEKKEICLAQIRMEVEARSRQAELDLQFQIRKLEIEADKQVKLRKLEIEEAKAASVSTSTIPSASASENIAFGLGNFTFDLSKNLPLVPFFRESEVDNYFGAFERVATLLKWPKDVWTLMLQCRFVGKAMEVFSTLSLTDSLQYEIVKNAVLQAYELVPEAYRQKFRNHRRQDNQTFVEFAREKGMMFDKWCTSNKVSSFAALRELMLLEDFKRCLPERIVIYLNEQKTTDLSTAAVLADEFALTHKGTFSAMRTDRNNCSVPVLQSVSNRNSPIHSKESRECFYCHKVGHVIADCVALKKKQPSLVSKPIAFVKTVSPSSRVVDYSPFLLKGFVSFTGKVEDQREIQVLRDTGAAHSFVCRKVLLFSEESHLGSSILVQGFGMEVMKVPLYRLHLQTDLVTGFVNVGVRDELPVPGVSFILGNDLAGGRVFPTLEVFDKPFVSVPDFLNQEFPEVFPSCVSTRSQKQKLNSEVGLTGIVLSQDKESDVKVLPKLMLDFGKDDDSVTLSVTRDNLIKAQKDDVTLSKCFTAMNTDSRTEVDYFVENGVLVRRWKSKTVQEADCSTVYQVVVPTIFRAYVLSLAHDHVLAGHLGITKTYDRILRHFFWPGLKRDVAAYCRSCHTCQMMGKPNQVIPPAPLKPIPVLGEPFEHVIIDCVGPLPKTKTGNQFLLTIMCIATRYPEALPLRNITAKTIVKALTKFFTTFGFPKVLQSDQGTNFVSKLFTQAMHSLGVSTRTSSPYHPERQGVLERFHQTLKRMLKKYCFDTGNDWDEGVPFVLFGVRETVQESLRFSPAELVFGHSVRGPLKVLKEKMLGLENDESPRVNVLDYVTCFRQRVQGACSFAREFLSQSQDKMKRQFDKSAVPRSFDPGDLVLVLLPIPGSALSACFTGPYEVLEKVSDTDYVISTPNRTRRKRVCHVNMLKTYHSRDNITGSGNVTKTTPVLVSCNVPVADDVELDIDFKGDLLQTSRFANSEIISRLSSVLDYLPCDQKQDVVRLIESYPQIFGDIPTVTNVLSHDIDVGSASPIKQHPYRVNIAKRTLMKQETEYLLEKNLATSSVSPWSSPCLLVPKPDGTVRFCTDYRKVNSVTIPDCFPLPRMEDCIDNIGSAKFITKLDMLKGYWQVPLTSHASNISAFVTPDVFCSIM